MREPSISDIQEVIQTLHNWVNSERCPRWANQIVLAMADLLDQILSQREEEGSNENYM